MTSRRRPPDDINGATWINSHVTAYMARHHVTACPGSAARKTAMVVSPGISTQLVLLLNHVEDCPIYDVFWKPSCCTLETPRRIITKVIKCLGMRQRQRWRQPIYGSRFRRRRCKELFLPSSQNESGFSYSGFIEPSRTPRTCLTLLFSENGYKMP